MTMTANATPAVQTVPGSQVGIAFYSSWAEAQQAINHLSKNGFPTEHIKIVASPSQAADQAKTVLNTNWVAFQGASEGAMVGLVLSVGIGLVNVAQPLTTTLFMCVPGMLGGAVVGLTLRLLGHSFSGTPGDFSAAPGMQDVQHIVMVDKHLSREASRLLEGPY
jgi:hypothetical protein